MDQTLALFKQLLSEKGFVLTKRQAEQFERYYLELVDWNSKMNLTAITDRHQVYIKHFYDSISLSFYVDLQTISSLADIGSGAGFPSIPLKIMFPQLSVTIIDSLNKRIGFLQHLVEVLELNQVACIHARAESAGHMSEYREQFQLVTARAVARLNILNELCLPFVQTGGIFAAMKGSDPQEEIEESAYSLKVLNSELKSIHAFKLPQEEASRHIVIEHKMGRISTKYPRNPGTPAKKPLISYK